MRINREDWLMTTTNSIFPAHIVNRPGYVAPQMVGAGDQYTRHLVVETPVEL